jgi:thiamine biosynthesis protein ThiS
MTETTTAITVTLNGKETSLPAGSTITSFLESRALTGKLVVVEINGTIVPRADFDERAFQSGDQVEVVHFVGGG